MLYIFLGVGILCTFIAMITEKSRTWTEELRFQQRSRSTRQGKRERWPSQLNRVVCAN